MTHVLHTHGKTKDAALSTFMMQNGEEFMLTFIHEELATPRMIGRPYSVETIDSYRAMDLKPAVSLQPTATYTRMMLQFLEPDGKHGVFAIGRQRVHVAIQTYKLSPHDLGKFFDVLAYPKYLSLYREADFFSPPEILEGQIIFSFPNHLVIVKNKQGEEFAVRERQPTYKDQIGQEYSFYVMPRKTIKDISRTNTPDAAVLTSIANKEQPESLFFQQFRTKKGMIAATGVAGTEVASPSLIGKKFNLETIDNYYLKAVRPSSNITPSDKKYTLIQVGNGHHYAIFSQGPKEIFVHLNGIDISPSQMGKEFELSLWPELYAWKAMPKNRV